MTVMMIRRQRRTFADVNASPAKHIMAVAKAGKRTARETIRALRLLGGVLDSTDLETE